MPLELYKKGDLPNHLPKRLPLLRTPITEILGPVMISGKKTGLPRIWQVPAERIQVTEMTNVTGKWNGTAS